MSLLFILVLSNVGTAGADTGRYTVSPCPPQEELDKLGDAVDMSGADRTYSFWEFPLSFKIAYIIGYLAAFASILKMVPLILGKVRIPRGNENRQKIYRHIRQVPGCTVSEISRDLEINRGAVRFHLEMLKAGNKISLMWAGKFTRVFQNSDVFASSEKIIIAHLKSSTRKQILLKILEKPEITNKELSEDLYLDKSTTYWHIKSLRDDRIILSETEGRSRKYFVNPALEADLLKWLNM
ncbi:winged helix-turn-helix transcriptional regulator [Methanosarcina sp. KYL-1]|uniref:winged helix-turn-helix transcriptional regulator n=1 Tax=Methanosarcina sp. KYL-1 TaxID=2602068 RepID=UPI002100A062|nr:winged helix-turn-helix transcriptional regulator [Methanosarcina sp. KYL-1]